MLTAPCCVDAAECATDNKPAERAPGQHGLAKLTAADSPLTAGAKIAFFGDSITMQGGYIDRIEKALAENERTKSLGVKFLRHGLNGGRVPTVLAGESPWDKLGASMQQLIAQEKPTVLVIYLGINDVWHGEKGTSKADYEAGLKQMVALGKQAGATVILCTPSVIGEETGDKNPFGKQLDEYSEIVRQVAKDQKLTLCDVRKAFVERLTEVNSQNKHEGNLTYDGVHMNDAGNELLADEVPAAICRAIKK